MNGIGVLRLMMGLLVLGTSLAISAGAADTPEIRESALAYASTARPLVVKYCLKCHSTEAAEGDLDLERFGSLGEVRKATAVWLKVAEMLDHGEMPPRKARQMSVAERKALRGWLARYLRAEALASAGDPGPVVIRRLTNAQYTYTLRDLTGVMLDPAREFPADGAAGEGFTNTGNALVMSPALISKYFDAAKAVAAHAVPLPDGLRFSASTTRRDWTNEVVEQIRQLYARYTDAGGGTQVNLQGIVFDTNEGGRLPFERYLAAALAEREALTRGTKTIEAVAGERKLSASYLGLLWSALNGHEPSLLLDELRRRWRLANPGQPRALVEFVSRWQSRLWKFNSVGHIGKLNGPKSWLEAVSPLQSRLEFRLPLEAGRLDGDVTIYLAADDAGDGSDQDVVVWERPRLTAPGMPDLPLRDVAWFARALAERKAQVFAATERCLAAAGEAAGSSGRVDVAALAEKHGVAIDVLAVWLDYLGLGQGDVAIESHLAGKIVGVSGQEFVNGWGSGETPNMVANASGSPVRIPGNLRPHSVAVHPSPSLRVAAGWLCPVAGPRRLSARVQHAHPECGNGVTWSFEVRRGLSREHLAFGVAEGGKVIEVGPFEPVVLRQGDLVSLVIGSRGGNHSCDLTAVDITITGGGRTWDLAADVSPDVLAGNPHADRQGHAGVWHFYSEPDQEVGAEVEVPAGSVLARWRAATSTAQRAALARELHRLLTSAPPPSRNSPDAVLYHQLASLRGPLFRSWRGGLDQEARRRAASNGPGPGQFGRLPDGRAIDPADLALKAPAVIAVTLPAELAEGCTLATGGRLADSGNEGSVQLAVVTNRPEPATTIDPARPILVADSSPARRRLEAAFDAFRALFPTALCYAKIVPVDEVITLTLFHREDEPLSRLMLDQAEAARLDRLWAELRFISQDALTLVDAFQQLLEYASQDGDPRVFEPLRKPIHDRAAAFRKELAAAEPKQLEAVIAFAGRAYRRPLTPAEADRLRGLYRRLRGEGLPHDEAWRLVLARVLVAPAFLYRIETAAPGAAAAPVNDWELASRLSYFLWSSMPDETLRSLAASGRLHEPDVAAAQARRMLKDPKVRRLAAEFACQWLHVYEFDSLDEKSDRLFPSFKQLRSAMYEETILFFADLFQRDLPVLALLDSDHTFLNGPLAEHYGIAGVTGADWRRVEGLKAAGRGGILGLATTLAKQSGASRTSPILRGNWVSEVLLGEKLPKPPPGVPPLPEDEGSTGGLSMRQVVERHSHDPRCTTCHARIDPFGYALEGFDAIGRRRSQDQGGHPIDVKARTLEGDTFEGLEGLRTYLLTKRRDAVARQFARKLLGYALGRAVALSDEPLLDQMTAMIASGGRIGPVVEAVVRSRQFREIRGQRALIAETY